MTKKGTDPASTGATLDESDYEVVIEEAEIGDPMAVIQFRFAGAKMPSSECPLLDVELKVALLWPQINHSLKLGKIRLSRVANADPYLFVLPYVDSLFPVELNHGIPTDIMITIKAKNASGKYVKMNSGQAIGEGKYLLVQEGVIPTTFKKVEKIISTFGNRAND